MKRTKKNRFNLLDIVIIIILLSLMVVSYLKTNHRQISMYNIEESTGTIILEVESQSNSDDFSQLTGTTLYLSDNNQKIGTVANVSISSENHNYSLLFNEMGATSKNRIYTVTLNDIILKKSDERGYYLNGSYYIANGKTISIKAQNGLCFPAIINYLETNN